MDTAPVPLPPPLPPANRSGDKPKQRDEPPWRRHVSWVLLCLLLVFPATLVAATGSLIWLNVRLSRADPVVALAVAVTVVMGWTGIKRGWDTRRALDFGWLLVVVVVVPCGCMMMVPAFARVRPSSQNKAVLNNARVLSAAADQYFLENRVTTCRFEDLVGPDKYVKAINTVAGETYPDCYTAGVTITVNGLAGVRTITYAP